MGPVSVTVEGIVIEFEEYNCKCERLRPLQFDETFELAGTECSAILV